MNHTCGTRRKPETCDSSPLEDALTPLDDLVFGTVLSSDKVFADDTTLPVLDPGRGRTKKGRLCCYAVDNRPWCRPSRPAAAYVYTEDRKSAHRRTLGRLQQRTAG